jgi:hypothetical protein
MEKYLKFKTDGTQEVQPEVSSAQLHCAMTSIFLFVMKERK